MDNKDLFTDDDCLNFYREGKEEFFNYLYNKYLPIAKKLAGIYYMQSYAPGLTEDDFLSVCLNSFYVASKTYKIGNNCFKAYWEKIIYYDIQHLLIDNSKHFGSNNVSLDSFTKNSEELTYAEVIGSTDERIYGDINVNEAITFVAEDEKSIFTTKEKKIFMLHMSGANARQIAKKLNLDEKHVRYMLSKISKKLTDFKNIK